MDCCAGAMQEQIRYLGFVLELELIACGLFGEVDGFGLFGEVGGKDCLVKWVYLGCLVKWMEMEQWNWMSA